MANYLVSDERSKFVLTTFQKIVVGVSVVVVTGVLAWGVNEIHMMRSALPLATDNAQELRQRAEWMRAKDTQDERQTQTLELLARNQTLLICEVRKLNGRECEVSYVEVPR
jgi:hypothetical protein